MAKNHHHSPAPKRRNKKHGRPGSFSQQLAQRQADEIAEQLAVAAREARYSPADIAQVSGMYWGAFLQLKQGKATEQQWGYVTTCTNLTLALMERGFGAEHIDHVIAALEGLTRVRERGQCTGSYRLDGPTIAAIPHVIEVHEAQLEAITHGDMLDAERFLEEQIHNGHVYNPNEQMKEAA